MRRAIIYPVLFLSIAAMTACNNKAQKVGGKDEPTDDSVSTVLYSSDSAHYAMHRFDSLSNAFFHAADSAEGEAANPNTNIVPIKGFTVRAVDVLAALGLPPESAEQCPYNHLRVYLGFTNQFKLLIVPVEDADLGNNNGGKDLLLNNQGIAIQPGDNPDQPTYVLDLNAPCPNTCAVNNAFQ